MATTWTYEKLDENHKIKYAPQNDMDGSITGRMVYGLKAWFDENPEERKRLGWTKHIHPDRQEIAYNHQTQYLVTSPRQIDEYTVRDEYLVMDKSEEMMLMEEIQGGGYSDGESIVWYGGM